MSLVQIGRLSRPHGLRGEVVLDRVSLSPEELEAVGSFTWEGPEGERRVLALASARPAHDCVLVRFEGVTDRDQAARLTHGHLLADRERVPDAGPGMAYTFQLVGLRVVTGDGRDLGVVAEVLQTGAHPIYVVRGAREIMIPAAPPVVRNVDLGGGVITVDLPAGLEDL